MRTGIGGLDLGIAGAPEAPEMGARLPVPGFERELHSGEPRWICMYCTAEGPGHMPERLHAEARCLGWRRWPYMLGDWIKRMAARPVRRRVNREQWEREHAPKPPVEFAYLGNISDSAPEAASLLGEPNTEAWRKGEELARQIDAKLEKEKS